MHIITAAIVRICAIGKQLAALVSYWPNQFNFPYYLQRLVAASVITASSAFKSTVPLSIVAYPVN